MRLAIALVALAACGGQPVLRNVPRPNPAVVAGAAAVVAGAATLANPAAAGHKPEDIGPGREKRPVHAETMPADVLDRLDASERGIQSPPER